MLVRAREYTCEGAHVRACVSRCVCERVCVIGRAWHYTGEPEASAVPKGRHPPGAARREAGGLGRRLRGRLAAGSDAQLACPALSTLWGMSSHKLRPAWRQRTPLSLRVGGSDLWSRMGRWPRSARTDRVSLLIHLL